VIQRGAGALAHAAAPLARYGSDDASTVHVDEGAGVPVVVDEAKVAHRQGGAPLLYQNLAIFYEFACQLDSGVQE
jgi:hypothetical protein